MRDWRIAFLGTFHPAVPTFEALSIRGWARTLVLPEEAGWKNDELLRLASEHGVPHTYDLADVSSADVDLVLAANYPKIVPASMLESLPCVNTHWSALPKYRGIHGTAWALINCDYDIGFTVHWMSEGFDEGDIIHQGFVRMQPDWDISDLHRELARAQADAVVRLLEEFDSPTDWPRRPQDHGAATYVPRRHPEDGEIDWSWTSERIWNLVRALTAPMYPGAFTFRGAERLTIWKARPAPCPPYFCTHGQVVRKTGDSVWVKAGDTCVEVHEVEWAEGGEGPMPAAQVLRLGEKLGRCPHDPDSEERG